MTRATRGLKDQRGTGTVEFALVIPVLLLILLTGIDFSRALIAYSTIGNATREGLRYATLHPGATHTEIMGAVRLYSGSLDPNLLELDVSYTERGTQPLGVPSRIPRTVTVKVTLRYPWESTSAIAARFFAATSGSGKLTSSAALDAQR